MLGILEGGGQCGRLIAELDWSATSLGPIASWPASLQATIANMLHTRQPMLLFWGPELRQFYNDAFVPSFGQGKHPQAMGQPARESWAEVWPVVGAQIEAVMSRGEPAWFEDALVPIHRNGRMEEVFWTYSYSPAYDDRGAVYGTLVIVTEMTARVLSERRLEALAALGGALAAAKTAATVFAAVRDVAARWPADLAFVLAGDPDTQVLQGVDPRHAESLVAQRPTAPELVEVELAEPVAGAVWPERVHHALACTLATRRWLMVGASPRLPLDDAYRSFVTQIAGQVEAALRRIDEADERSRILLALQDAVRMKDEFLAMLGHELRNPLAPIVTALELLNQKGAAGIAERAVIERQVHHVIRLVDDLLDISRITRGSVSLTMAPVDLRVIVESAVEASKHLVEQRGHRLVLDLAQPVFVSGDEVRLVQVVLNLLTNAARYTPNGGTIRVVVASEPETAVLRVEDTGIGISSELLPRLFDTFVQGARSVERAEGGLGLGLSIVKNLVTLHGGTVDVTSDGHGSAFSIRLPRISVPASKPPPVARAPKMITTAQRVLVVDDNEDAAQLLGELARTRGHDVTVVHAPQAALDIVLALQPQVAVLDIGLPGMDGYQLASRVRELCPNCRLVALTGYGQEKDRERSREAGFALHLVKPVRIDQLLAAIGP